MLASPAGAQDPLPPDAPLNVGPDDLVLELGIGAKVVPAYEGADDYLLQPWPIAQIRYLRLPVIGDFGGGRETGALLSPFVPLRAARDEDDYSDLEGLGDVSAAYEFGATVGYRYDFVRGFLTFRHGFGGHQGWSARSGST